MIHYSYDVFSFDGDLWSLQRTYSTTQSTDAFKYAQKLYAEPQTKGVRIIQEIFDTEEGGAGRRPMLSRIKATAMSRVDVALNETLQASAAGD
ncbi:MAG TPA: hypothetical protein VGB82_17280 [Alphaproteobacteria bacterium]